MTGQVCQFWRLEEGEENPPLFHIGWSREREVV